MAKNEEEVTKWTRIAAGVHGTFGDSLPIEGLVESANETARTGKVTGVFADALNWVGIMEDDFNAKLEQTTDVSKRNRLIMDTLSTTYDKAADSFYANNQQVINARRNHATLDETLAKVGDTSSKVKNQLWVLAGAAEDGSIRSGSALDWVQQKAEAFGAWVEGLDLSALKQQFDENFTQGLQRAGDAMDWCREHADGLKTGVKLLAAVQPERRGRRVGAARHGKDRADDDRRARRSDSRDRRGHGGADRAERRDERKPGRRGHPADRGRNRGRCAAV